MTLLGATGMFVAVRSAVAQRPDKVTIRLDANRQLWMDTSIELAAGEVVEFTATGTAGWLPGLQVGPDGARVPTSCTLVAPDAPVGALLGRVGNGPPVLLGAAGMIAGPGHIHVLYNDCPGHYFDNRGSFEITFTFPAGVATTSPPAVQETTVAPVATVVPSIAVRAPQGGGQRVDPWIPLVVLAVIGIGAGVVYGRRFLPNLLPRGKVAQFGPTARLESSAWLAPVRLRAVQGERRPKKYLSIGGPDADIDFGLPGVWARLHPTEDGGARLEALPNKGRILVDGRPIVMGQRLTSGSRVFMNTREFVFRSDAEDASPPLNALNRRGDALSRPDPRVAAMGE